MSVPLCPGVDVSRETWERLKHYEALVRHWQARINLVARSTLDDLWTRHVVDSAQLMPLAGPWAHWIDLGSGAGFPGLVVAILAAPGQRVTLIESVGKKAAFLREAARETGAAVTVEARRVENATPALAGSADIVSARALAPLDGLLPLVHPLLKEGGKALLPKGAKVLQELTLAERSWKIQRDLILSVTDPEGRIVRITALNPIGPP